MGRWYDSLLLQEKVVMYFVIVYFFVTLLYSFRYFRVRDELPDDERTTYYNYVAACFGIGIHLLNYLTDCMVILTLYELENQNVLFVAALASVGSSVFLLSYLGFAGSELRILYLPRNLLAVGSGLYQLNILGELVEPVPLSSRFYSRRGTMNDMVRLKYIEGLVEGIPMIGIQLFVLLEAVATPDAIDLVLFSLVVSILSLCTGLVMYDYDLDVGRPDYETDNTYNYLFHQDNTPTYRRDWLITVSITRILESFARLGFYATFAGVSPRPIFLAVLIGAEFVGIWLGHRFAFVGTIFLELIFNIRDSGKFFIARDEWFAKFCSTTGGFIWIGLRLAVDPSLMSLDNSTSARAVIFWTTVTTNLLLFPWIFYLFYLQLLKDETSFFGGFIARRRALRQLKKRNKTAVAT